MLKTVLIDGQLYLHYSFYLSYLSRVEESELYRYGVIPIVDPARLPTLECRYLGRLQKVTFVGLDLRWCRARWRDLISTDSRLFLVTSKRLFESSCLRAMAAKSSMLFFSFSALIVLNGMREK